MKKTTAAHDDDSVSLASLAVTTRDKILRQAQSRFSSNGFHGTSLAEVAEAVGIKKPSLLYHFPSKNKLYGAVLARVADGLLAEIERINQSSNDPKVQIITFMGSFDRWGKNQPEQATLILREMLDNPTRAAKATNWYLAPFIEKATAIIEAGQDSGCV